MDQSSVIYNSNTSFKFAIIFGIIGIILIVLLIFFYCRNKHDHRQSNSNSIESFQQLYFTKTSNNDIKHLEQRVIERWSSTDQPSMTFYRVYIQDNSDDFYRPVTEERLRSSIEQSKAMEYAGHEIIFF